MNKTKRNKGEILIGQPVNLIPLDRAKGAVRSSDKSLRWRLDVDDPKIPGDARISRNHYTTAPLVTNPCCHELASPRRLALVDATRTQERTKKIALTTGTDELNSDNWDSTNRL